MQEDEGARGRMDDAYYDEVRRAVGRGAPTVLIGTSTRSLERSLTKLRAVRQGESPPSRVPSKRGNAGDDDGSAPRSCPRIPVNMADVFPQGCYLVPDSISERYDYDEKTETRRPSIDRITGKRVYQCRVVDMDPEREGLSRETAVTIVADHMPVSPTGVQYEPVEFEDLTATPYLTDRGRAALTSLRATGIRSAIARPAPGTGQVPATAAVWRAPAAEREAARAEVLQAERAAEERVAAARPERDNTMVRAGKTAERTSASAAEQAPTQSAMAVPSIRQKMAGRDGFLTPVLGLSIAIAIFAVVTQALAGTDAISLSTTQQLLLWLVATGLIALLWIAYMAIKAQAQLVEMVRVSAREQVEAARATAREQVAQAQAARAAAEREAVVLRGRDDSAASAESGAATAQSLGAWVPPGKLRRAGGLEQSVNTADVFPDGCLLEEISEAQIYDEETKTNRRVYKCVVVDLNRALQDGPHDVVVTIVTDQELSLPPKARHRLVEFDGLTIVSRVTDRSPIRIGHELRATGIRVVAGQA